MSTVAIAASLFAMSCSSSGGSDAKSSPTPKPTTVASEGGAEQRSASMSPTEVLDADLQYSTFNRVVTASGLAGTLDDADELTIFAPSNAAFEELGPDDTEALIADPAASAAFVQSHAVPAAVALSDLLGGGSLTDLAGNELMVGSDEGVVRVGGAIVVLPNISTDNGYLHVVDSIIGVRQ